MTKPVLVWSDLTINGGSDDLKNQFANYCEVRTVGTQTSVAPRPIKSSLYYSCLEYDYPDKRSLAILQKLKQEHSSVPLIMITLAHSEALAVWAFRAGVWDYLTKPTSDVEIERVCARMLSLEKAHKPNSLRQQALGGCEIPLEAQYVAKAQVAETLHPAMTYLQTHYAEKITEKQVSRICNMTTFRFSRAFRQSYDTTFREWLLKYRITQSKRFLSNPNLSITQVAFMVGFNDASHFGKMFRRFNQQTASDFRTDLANQTIDQMDDDEWSAETLAMEQPRASLHPPSF